MDRPKPQCFHAIPGAKLSKEYEDFSCCLVWLADVYVHRRSAAQVWLSYAQTFSRQATAKLGRLIRTASSEATCCS